MRKKNGKKYTEVVACKRFYTTIQVALVILAGAFQMFLKNVVVVGIHNYFGIPFAHSSSFLLKAVGPLSNLFGAIVFCFLLISLIMVTNEKNEVLKKIKAETV